VPLFAKIILVLHASFNLLIQNKYIIKSLYRNHSFV